VHYQSIMLNAKNKTQDYSRVLFLFIGKIIW